MLTLLTIMALSSCKDSKQGDTEELQPKAQVAQQAQPEPAQPAAPRECSTQCVTPFGTALGSNRDIVGYSNCQPACIDPKPVQSPPVLGETEGELVYTGINWQCVEYARRWWLQERGIVFGSVDTANDMWTQISAASVVADNSEVTVIRHVNGGEVAPIVGDLIIYKSDEASTNLKYGHVAVVVGLDEKAGTLSVAEQNFENREWQDPKSHARTLAFRNDDGHMTLYDLPADTAKLETAAAARIYGWLRAEQ